MKFEEARARLADGFMRVGAVLTRESDHPLVVTRDGPNGPERGFRLKLHEKNPEAPLSPFFLNLRTSDNPKPGPLTPEIVGSAASCMYALAFREQLEYNFVVGVPNAGDPFATRFSLISFTVPALKMAKENTADGKRHIASLTSKVLPGATAMVLDDLVTGADSKLEAIQVLEAAGLMVRDVLVLVDREQGGKEELAAHGYKLHSVFTITELLQAYVSSGKMDPALADEIRAYLK